MQPQEDTRMPLEQFGQDFTALAKEGKLDPVIGRDEEIRRCMQVLSRRSNNQPSKYAQTSSGQLRYPKEPFAMLHLCLCAWLGSVRFVEPDTLDVQAIGRNSQ